jgi:drug/metabolite transporter (DMT)-like permease
MGELAAFTTAIFWSLTSIFFSKSSQSLGSVYVNRLRLALAVLFLMVTHFVLQGSLLPIQAAPERWFWLGLSALSGLVFGDSCLLQAYVLIGPRLGTLMMAMSPVIGTILAWAFLGETLSLIELAGILITVMGVSVVVLEKRNGVEHPDRRRYFLGILFGLGGAIGQTGGLVLAKKGLVGDFPALSGVIMRMVVAMSVMWLIAIFSKDAVRTIKVGLDNRRMLGLVSLGAFFGPFLGVWLSLFAVQNTYIGVASTLMALQPIIVLPILKFWFKEKVSIRAVVGTVIALTGVTLLFLNS